MLETVCGANVNKVSNRAFQCQYYSENGDKNGKRSKPQLPSLAFEAEIQSVLCVAALLRARLLGSPATD